MQLLRVAHANANANANANADASQNRKLLLCVRRAGNERHNVSGQLLALCFRSQRVVCGATEFAVNLPHLCANLSRALFCFGLFGRKLAKSVQRVPI